MRGPSIERGIDGLTAQKSETLSDQFFLGVSVGRKKLTGVGWWPGVVRGCVPIVTWGFAHCHPVLMPVLMPVS
jgi:hypothetical protein